MSEGLSNREIASVMFLAEKTVKNYVSNLLAKLGFQRRTEAALFAQRQQGRAHGGALVGSVADQQHAQGAAPRLTFVS